LTPISKSGFGAVERINPEDPSFCSAKCYPVLVGGRFKGAIAFPLFENDPENNMELIAPQKIKDTLSFYGRRHSGGENFIERRGQFAIYSVLPNHLAAPRVQAFKNPKKVI